MLVEVWLWIFQHSMKTIIEDEDWNFGGAVAFSTGYELVQKKNFALDLQTQLQMGWTNLDNDRNRDAVVLSIGLGFHWY